MEATIRHRVEFYEVDGAGIVHFSWFFRYMEEAEHALWRRAGLSIAPTGELAFPRVAASFDFRRPLRFEDEFDAQIQITEFRSKTITYSCSLTRDGELLASGTMTIACVSTVAGQPMRAVPFPDGIRKRLSVTDQQP